jgi:hypothetical protein
MSGKAMQAQLTAKSQPYSAANLPDPSTIRRARAKLRHETEQYYDENWARLEEYLEALDDSDDFYCALEKWVSDNSFKRYFVGIKAAVKVMKEAGLDYYAIDACHLQHFIVKGMALHLLVARQGQNHNLLLAISLEASETSDSYVM